MRILLILSCLLSSLAYSDDTPKKDQPVWIDEQMEEMVLPLKQWLEKTIRSDDKKEPRSRQNQLNLRQAIRVALKNYPGTVLSAKEKEDGYHIKILSKNGVVKIVRLPYPTLSEDIQPEQLPTQESK